nr:lysophosphatidylcholine acyltransferase 2-like [Biomphalaria glabrata]
MSRNNIPRQKSLSTPEVLNPFVHKLNLSLRDKIQIAIMSVTIAPIRLVLVLLLLLLAWPFAALAVAFRSEEDKLKPITGWRLLLRPIVLVLCRGVFFAGGLYWVKTKGKQASSKEAPLLLLAPHSSFLDALPTVFLGLTSVVAKASTQDMILFGIYIGRAIIVAAGFVVWPIKGNRAPPSQAPVLVAAPHSGIFDIILYFLVIPMSSPVSRNENGNIPIFGSNENKDRNSRSHNRDDSPRSHNRNDSPRSHNRNDSPRSHNRNDSPRSHNRDDSPRSHNRDDSPRSHNRDDSPRSHNRNDSLRSHNRNDSPRSHNRNDSLRSHNRNDSLRSHNRNDSPRSHNRNDSLRSHTIFVTGGCFHSFVRFKLNFT